MACSGGCACGRMLSLQTHLASGSETSAKGSGKLEKTQQTIGRFLAGSMISGFIHIGLRLGLYQALVDVDNGAGVSSPELAAATGKAERWLREWLASQAAAGILDWSDQPEMRYRVSPETKELLLNPESPSYMGGFIELAESVIDALPAAEKSFTTGIGHTYDNIGRKGNAGMSNHHIPVFIHTLIPKVLPKLAGGKVIEALRRGCRVADVGCGAAGPSLVLAAAFPTVDYHGFEISDVAIELSKENQARAGVANFRMHNVKTNSLAQESQINGKFDFVLTYDVLHDMAHPEVLAQEVKEALAPGGTWLVVDIKNYGSIGENIRKLRLDAAVKYSISMCVCMSSALSEPDGLGLGTLGLSVDIATKMFTEAGLTKTRPFLVEGVENQFFEVTH